MNGHGINFAAIGFRSTLNHLAELDLQPTRQANVVVPLKNIGYAALTRLAVDTNNFFVAAAQIERIDWQVGNIPYIPLFPACKALAYGVLMAAGECSEHQLASVWMARMGGNFCTGFNHLRDLRHA